MPPTGTSSPPSCSKAELTKHPSSPWPWLALTQSLSCKNILRLFPHQNESQMYTISLNASWSYLSLLKPGSHFTHLQFPFSFSDKTRFCQHWHFSVTMYFSDSPIESKWSLAPFNSDIAFGSHTDVCHCSFYFGGSGMHRLGRLCYASHQHKSDHAILLLTTPQWVPIRFKTLHLAFKHLHELIPP